MKTPSALARLVLVGNHLIIPDSTDMYEQVI